MLKNGADLLYKSSLFIALLVLLLTSWNAPISGDEYVHVQQAKKNINYLRSFGSDKSALDTPISRLKHYGQSFDTITLFVAEVLAIKDLYRFRHMANACIAWLTILFASMITFRITKSKAAAFLSVILFLVSLRFMGHAMNNLKDVPFAFAFIFSIYFMLRFIEKLPIISWKDLAWLTFGLAFGISIRIGGLLVFAYLLLFTGLFLYYLVITEVVRIHEVLKLAAKLTVIFPVMFLIAYIGAALIWPYALEDPLRNPWVSMELIQHYPTTVRQIFEGQLYWSDQFPWYYLPKYLMITLPIILILGFILALVFVWKLKKNIAIIYFVFLLIAFGFPIFYTIVTHANIYGGWRQMLFVFPPIVVLSSMGLWLTYEQIKSMVIPQILAMAMVVVLLYGPVKFFITNYPYHYTFFNELTGGAKGAFGHYELDYYFTSFKKAYEFIDTEMDGKSGIVAANFVIPEYYKHKNYRPKLIDYYERSSVDWDYAIICNAFLDAYQLQHGLWPPSNAIYIEKVDEVPIMAVLKRTTKDDLSGKMALDRDEYVLAIAKLKAALEIDSRNESIMLNLARAYVMNGHASDALSVIEDLEKLYPSNEWAKDLKGEIAFAKGDKAEAIGLFKDNIRANSRFYHSYVNLAKVLRSQSKNEEAISHLKTCLRMNPFYRPAYQLYGQMLIEQGNAELGNKMLEYSKSGKGRYGSK
jgi:predicted negative regulator of RcsB-dependent stress response